MYVKDYQTGPLQHFLRSLSRVDWRIVVSERFSNPVTIVTDSKTIAVQPSLTLFDLAVASCCDDVIEYAKRLSTEESHNVKGKLTGYARSIASRAANQVMELAPGLSADNTFFGVNKVETDLAGFWVEKNSVGLDPFELDWGSAGGINALGIEGIESTTSYDMKDLEALIQQGKMDWEYLPGFEEFPFQIVPYRFCNIIRSDWDQKELRHPEVIKYQKMFYDCIQRSSESREEYYSVGQLKHQGVNIEHSRLVPGYLSGLRGESYRLFRNRLTQLQAVFNPDQHFVHMEIDLNDLRRTFSGKPADQHGTFHLLLGNILALAMLGSDLQIDLYSDRIVELPDSRIGFIQFRERLKSINEPMNNERWLKLIGMLKSRGGVLGRPATFHPITARQISRSMLKSTTNIHNFRTLFWISRRAPTRILPVRKFQSTFERMARYIDNTLNELDGVFTPGVFGTGFVYLPLDILEFAKSGGLLRKLYDRERKYP